MKGIDFSVDEYVAAHQWCEAWEFVTEPIHDWLWMQHGLAAFKGRIHAWEIAHICRGAGRKHYRTNVLHLNSAVHLWCDGHGLAGKTLLLYAKFKSADGIDWDRIDKIRGDNVRGVMDSDEWFSQCMDWGIDHYRREMVATQDEEFGIGIEIDEWVP